MRSYDEIQSRIDTLEAALTALQNEGGQDDEENQLATFVIGALNWATARETPAAKRVENLVGRFETNLKRMQRKQPKAKRVHREPALAATGDGTVPF